MSAQSTARIGLSAENAGLAAFAGICTEGLLDRTGIAAKTASAACRHRAARRSKPARQIMSLSREKKVAGPVCISRDCAGRASASDRDRRKNCVAIDLLGGRGGIGQALRIKERSYSGKRQVRLPHRPGSTPDFRQSGVSGGFPKGGPPLSGRRHCRNAAVHDAGFAKAGGWASGLRAGIFFRCASEENLWICDFVGTFGSCERDGFVI